MSENKLTCFQCRKQFSIKLVKDKSFYQRFKHTGFGVRNYIDLEQIPNTIYFCGTVCKNTYIRNKYKKKKF